jgi:endogenous inhibitor of DNA gyrase (YacG/DUF329 family)
MSDPTIRCPACGQAVDVEQAEEKGEEDPHAVLTCPTCGAGFDRHGCLVHDPPIGP